MPTTRLFSSETVVRLDDISGEENPDYHRLVFCDMNSNFVVFEGTSDSLLMLADRINDRLHPLKEN